MKEKKIAKPDSAHTGERFQKLRCVAGLSQEEAAEKLSQSTRTIQRYKAGETTPDYFTLRNMINCYQCEAADLFGSEPFPDQGNRGDV